MSTVACARLREDVVGLLEGSANEELRAHIAGCDACRDASHALEGVAARIGKAGDDFVVSAALADRLAQIAEEAEREIAREERVSETRLRGEEVALAPAAPKAPSSQRPSKRSIWLLVAACVSVAASAAIGFKLADHRRSPAAAATRSWHGKVAKIAKSGADKATPGLAVVTPSGKIALAEGAEVKAGMHLATDSRTRARLELDDGSAIILDRATEATITEAPRTLDVSEGAVLADVAHVDGAPWAKVKTANAEVRVLGTKLAVTAASDRTNVEVLRGEVEIASGSDTHKVAAGQEGVVAKDGRVDVAPANDLAQRAAFGEQLIATHNEDAEAPASGLGELRAKKPGRTDEKDHAVRLAKHAVKVRIAGNVARTEIDEEFANDTDEVLEGIYRFPLPPGAQIERLALETDGKLLDGEFVDKAKASAIWRGAIQNAAPQAPKPKEEIVWVPGPWRDPALLEWQRGGRFELRIFPIPKRGSRRVVIAYTETVTPVSGVRRYVYPLPQGSSSKLTIDQFAVDAQVLGHDGKSPVRVRGYELEQKDEGAAKRFTTAMTGFTPSGDLAIEYALDDKASDATAWGYAAPPAAVAAEPAPATKAKGAVSDPIGKDGFVAIALRPKLPRWTDTRPRDHVIVVDVGRTMFGERFARAKRLAVQMAQEMDRRDRLTVLACDVSCRAMPGGFVAPGAPSAHDVDAFLAAITPDGASDLVGAMRAASKIASHDDKRDLRVALLSDGVATAGYRSPSRVAAEVTDAIGDPRALAVTVPIGADADVALLSEIARGGGGVVVPYQPGQRLEASALEVLNATYGTTLRDVEVVLPPGMHDQAPATLSPLRAGSETIVTARMTGENVKGEIILRGKVGGDPFEAKYPVDVRASADAGNAFVPRLFAASRIADRERELGEGPRAELVALSQRYAVPTRFTSLLVLESEAMFKAFGIDRAAHGPSWTGESQAQGFASGFGPGHLPPTDSSLGTLADALNPFEGEVAEKRDKSGEVSAGTGTGQGFGVGGGGKAAADIGRLSGAAPAPAPTMAPPAAPAKKPSVRSTGDELSARAFGDVPMPANEPRGRSGRFMKRVFVRHATIASGATPSVAAEKVAQARAAVAAAPDERSKHKDLARMLALSAQLDELGETLEKWSTRDPLDIDVIVGRADLAARRGDREASMRILGGALAANALSSQEAFVVAQTVGRSFDRVGRTESCAFYVAAAELRPADVDAVARAISCERRAGHAASAERWLVGMKDTQRAAVNAAITKAEAAKAETAFGDVVVSATWSGGVDLDVSLIDPSGRRAAAGTRMKGARVEGATARDHETVALSSGDGGSFLVEVVRASMAEGTTPVSGSLTVRAFGQAQTIPFTLTGARGLVGRVDVRWEQELVPVDDVTTSANVFDRGAAAGALGRINVSHCGASGQVGTGHATVSFAPSGRVTDVSIDDANFSGTPAGRCVRAALFSATVPPFSGGNVQIGKSFTVGSPLAR